MRGLKVFLVVLILCMCLHFKGSGNAQIASPPSPIPPTQGLGGPVMRMDERAYDFGMVVGLDKIEHTFYVKNPGSADLEIRNVQVS
jgi:hypothetical protein